MFWIFKRCCRCGKSHLRDVSAEKVFACRLMEPRKSLKRGWNAVLLRRRAAWTTPGGNTLIWASFPDCSRGLEATFVRWAFHEKKGVYCDFWTSLFFGSRLPGYHESSLWCVHLQPLKVKLDFSLVFNLNPLFNLYLFFSNTYKILLNSTNQLSHCCL